MKTITSIEIQVFQSEGMWIAQCDEIGLVTEAKSLDDLLQRASELAPELILENKSLHSDRRRPAHLAFQVHKELAYALTH